MTQETWEKRFNQEFTHDGAWAVEDNGCRVSPRQVKDFIRTELQKAREEEWKRCVDTLDHDHSKCIIRETCIGYIAAQSDLMNNPPESQKINQEDK